MGYYAIYANCMWTYFCPENAKRVATLMQEILPGCAVYIKPVDRYPTRNQLHPSHVIALVKTNRSMSISSVRWCMQRLVGKLHDQQAEKDFRFFRNIRLTKMNYRRKVEDYIVHEA